MPHRIIVWTGAESDQLVRDTLSAPELIAVAIGSDDPSSAGRMCNELGVTRTDDLRQTLHRDDADVILLAGPLRRNEDLLRLMAQRRRPTASIEPLPASMSDEHDAALAQFVPQMRRSPGYRAALDVLGDFGEALCVMVTMRSGRGEGSLFARLYDAMDVIDHLCGEAESIDAALATRMPDMPENLAGLCGHMTINMRFPGSRCACVAVSDSAGTWFRGVTVLGETGCLRISDDGFEWTAPDGQVLDSHESEERTTPGTLIGMQIARLLDGLDAGEPPPEHARLLALCEAARLSARTGQGEAPRKMLRMLSRP